MEQMWPLQALQNAELSIPLLLPPRSAALTLRVHFGGFKAGVYLNLPKDSQNPPHLEEDCKLQA